VSVLIRGLGLFPNSTRSRQTGPITSCRRATSYLDAMICPLTQAEKQALLEASDLDDRASLLTAIVRCGAEPPNDGAAAATDGAALSGGQYGRDTRNRSETA